MTSTTATSTTTSTTTFTTSVTTTTASTITTSTITTTGGTETTTSSELCECECWVYDLLYGDSPYNNLTYEEIETALENVTKRVSITSCVFDLSCKL